MTQNYFLEAHTPRQISGVTAAGTGDITTSIIDTQGFDEVVFMIMLGDCSNTSVITGTVQQNTANSTSGMASLVSDANVSFTATATSADSKILVSDIIRPRERYLQVVISRATANAAVNSVVAILAQPRSLPTAAGDIVASKKAISPAQA